MLCRSSLPAGPRCRRRDLGPRSNPAERILFVRNHLLPRLRALSMSLERTKRFGTDNTAIVTEAIEAAALKCGLVSKREVRVGRLWTENGPPRRGRVDLVVATENWTPFWRRVVYAIELDRQNKAWSVEKLRNLRRLRGWIPIWVRWNGRLGRNLPDDICVIDMCQSEIVVHVPKQPMPKRRPWRLR